MGCVGRCNTLYFSFLGDSVVKRRFENVAICLKLSWNHFYYRFNVAGLQQLKINAENFVIAFAAANK